jgi:steroid delta-isomerase-like uncharacterized protein
MSEANKLLVARWFEEVWNQKSEAAIEEMFCSEGRAHGFPDPESVLAGPDAFKAVHRRFCGAFPDLHVEIQDMVAEGDRIAVRWKVTMTHLGDDLGFPASGKSGVLHGSSFLIVKGDQILDGWNQMDLQALFQKLNAAEC